MKKRMGFLLLFMLGAVCIYAQQEIKGTVTGQNNEPLQNVSVLLQGTARGTQTDAGGNFTLRTDKSGKLTLVFTYTGYKPVTVEADETKAVIVKLDSIANTLDDVVVIGYGTQRRGDVTTAVASVKSGNFVKGAVRDPVQLLQGKVSGLVINVPSGDPTTNSQIMLRGTATLKTSTQPLILIDGIPGDLNIIAPEDIESIDVLKDGSAAAIYGTRGTNGVILIVTKRPTTGSAPAISFNGYASTQSIAKSPQMLNASEYRKLIGEGVAFQDLGGNTDWLKKISNSFPLSHVHTVSISGGNAQTNYIGTMNYRYLEGIFQKSDNRLINARLDVNHSMFNNKLRLNFNIINSDSKYTTLTLGGLTNNSTVNTTLGANYNGLIYREALIQNPTQPIKNADGTYAEQVGIDNYANPVALINESDGKTRGQKTRVSGSITWLPVASLRLKALVSRTKTDQAFGYAESKLNLSTLRDGRGGYAQKTDLQQLDNLLELTAEYNKKFGDHNFSVLGGYSYQDVTASNSAIANWGFPAGNFSYADNIGLGNALKAGNAIMTSGRTAANLIGFFGRVTYSYRDKYLLLANVRYEESSKFVGTNQPWGTFPAISAGWRVSQEGFMKNVSFINDLKFRAGYGVTGTAPDVLFLGVSRLGYTDAGGNVGYSLINGQWVPTLVPVSNPNPYLRWEEKHETNVGMDFTMFKRRLSGSVDYYSRRTKGLLYDYPVPSPPNLYTTTTANVGKMQNKGLEVLLTYNAVQGKNFSWTTTATFSANSNKLLSLENDLYKLTNNYINVGSTGSPIQTYTHRVQVGEPIGNFYGYKVTGVTDDGHWIYEDKDGKETEDKGGEENKRVLGNGIPKYYAGWNNTFRFKNVDFGVTMRGAFKYQILNFVRMFYENPGTTQYNQLKSAQDKMFGTTVLNKDVPLEYNSYYIENGDFWKIDNLTLGYNFNTSKIRFAKNLRLYVSVINTATFTKYKGNDPEVNILGLTPGDDDRDKYPATRVYTAGVNVSF